ncbi:MAG: type II secretion system protein GspM [Deltaproteobacteria bacterium]|nr:type II secretion system protein GspM [Deltaproteobacteria bacterium]
MKKNGNLLWIAVPVLIVLLGAVVYQYGFLRVRAELSEMEETVAVKSKLLGKYMALIADKPRIEQALTAVKETRKAQNAKMIEGQTASVAAAALQSMVKEIILSRGGNITSERVEKPEDAGKFKMITVTIDAVLPDTRLLGDTLYTIETQTPYLVVRELDVRIRNFKEPRDLTVKLKVSGLTGGA